MRVVCPYTKLHLLTETSLAEHAAHAELVQLDATRPDAYWSAMAAWWADGESFTVVEHDIEIHGTVLADFTACPEVWCIFPYMGPSAELLFMSLGCTRFRSVLITAEPDLLEAVGRRTDGLPQKDWRRMDTLMLGELRERGYSPHPHDPPVLHHHSYAFPVGSSLPDGCACGMEHD